MNRARAVAALRDLADALEADDEDAKPRRRRARTIKLPVRPAVVVDDVAKARADRALRQKGFVSR